MADEAVPLTASGAMRSDLGPGVAIQPRALARNHRTNHTAAADRHLSGDWTNSGVAPLR